MAFPQKKGSIGNVYYNNFELLQKNSIDVKSDQNKAIEDYIIELFPGQEFDGWYYYWAIGGIKNCNLKEYPEVGWLSVSPNTFTSTGCTNIIPVKYSFIAPMEEGVYVSNLIDNNGTWDTMRVELTVTKSPKNCIIRRIGINQDVLSYKSMMKNPALNWNDNTCVKDYWPADSIKFDFYLESGLDWLKISPLSGKTFRNEKQIFQNTLNKKLYDSSWVTLVRNFYSYPVHYHYYVKETKPRGYVLHFNGENHITTTYYPFASTKTMMYWVRFDEISDQVIGVHDGENHRFYLGIQKDNSLYAGMGDSYNPLTSLNLIPGKWYNLALTTSGDSDSAIVYINATEVARWKYSFAGESKANLYIAARNDFSTFGYNIKGCIDEVQVWERPLSRYEIVKYMFTPPSGNEDGLVIYYPFSEGWGNFTKNQVDNYYYGNLNKEADWIDYLRRPIDPDFLLTGEIPNPDPLRPPILLYPLNNETDIAVNTVLSWYPTYRAETYRLQVSENFDFATTVLDQIKINWINPFFSLTNLSLNTTYFWRVNATNLNSSSDWSETRKFITGVTTGVEPVNSNSITNLKQNYPNPFTQLTKIEFNILNPGHTEITIYDLLGIKISTLLNEYLEQGLHSVDWIPTYSLKSGIYYYQLRSSGIIETKRMIYDKR